MNRQNNEFTITGFSTALFSTWYFVDQMGILFDCGDGVSSALMQKAGKIKHVFISHADRDHLGGLLQFQQLNGKSGLKIYYPADSGSFPALAEFAANFDPHVSGTQWIPIRAAEEIQIRADLCVRAVENAHIKTQNGQTKSLSYFVDHVSRKLKPSLSGQDGSAIAKLKQEQGEEAISDISRTTKLIYSGDTPIELDGRYNDTEILIHEATFLTAAEIDPDDPRRNKHSSLDQVIAMVAKSNIQQLVLGHFSNRYDHDQIDKAISQQCAKHKLTIPVFRILPGQVARDFLNGN